MNIRSLVPFGDTASTTPARTGFIALQREIDRIFDEFANNLGSRGLSDFTPKMDARETDTSVELSVELPGIEEKNVDVSVSGNMLTIKGEKKSEVSEEKGDTQYSERRYGAFRRTLELPSGVDASKIQAKLANGVLTVSVPKPAVAESKKIAVKAAA